MGFFFLVLFLRVIHVRPFPPLHLLHRLHITSAAYRLYQFPAQVTIPAINTLIIISQYYHLLLSFSPYWSHMVRKQWETNCYIIIGNLFSTFRNHTFPLTISPCTSINSFCPFARLSPQYIVYLSSVSGHFLIIVPLCIMLLAR